MKKEIDRHADEPTSVLPVRYPTRDLLRLGRIAKKDDKTKGAVLREALRLYLEMREEAR